MGRGLVYVFTTVIPDLYLKFKSDKLKICKINQFEPLLINLASLIRPFTLKVNFTKYGYGRWYYNTHPFWNDTPTILSQITSTQGYSFLWFQWCRKVRVQHMHVASKFQKVSTESMRFIKVHQTNEERWKSCKFVKLRQMGVIEKLLRLGGIV